MNQLAQKIYQSNKQRFEAAANPLRSHGPDHHYRVYMQALSLATKLGASYDEDILAAACLLHDMAAYYPEKVGDDYHDFDHQLAEEVLREIDFPKEKIQAVVDAIANHGSDPKYKQVDEPTEITLLRDADKLDVFGPIGVARIIMVRTLKDDTLEEIVDDFWTRGHLQRKWESISTDVARELANDDYEYSRHFFATLAESFDKGNLY